VDPGARELGEPRGSDLGRDLDDLFASPSTNVFEIKATVRLGD